MALACFAILLLGLSDSSSWLQLYFCKLYKLIARVFGTIAGCSKSMSCPGVSLWFPEAFAGFLGSGVLADSFTDMFVGSVRPFGIRVEITISKLFSFS